jgi:hypothetical protein
MASDDEYARELEKRAEELGLPTDPAAYQDGGVAVVATAMNLAEAETLTALLKVNDVPAWVKAPLATLMVAEPQMFSVLVPLGRLADARKLIEEHRGAETHPEEEEPERKGPWVRAFLIGTIALFGLGLALSLAGAIYLFILMLLDRHP